LSTRPSPVRPVRRASAPALLAFLLTSCADPEPPPDDDDEPVQPATCAPDDEQCDPYDQTNFLGTQSTALCSFLFDCCSGVERNDVVPLLLGPDGDDALDQLLVVEPDLLSDELACVRALAPALSAVGRADAPPLLDEATPRRAFDRDAAETCIGQIEEAAELCAPPLLFLVEATPAECARIFAPAVAEGGACASDADCVDIDNEPATCFANDGPDGEGGFDVSITGTCERVPALNEACAFEGGVCESGLFCSSALVCLPLAGEGEPCGDTPCELGLRCLGTCAPLVPSGQDPAVNACAFDEDCASGLCVEVQVEAAPDVFIVIGLCTDAPAIDPLDVRFDFCLADQGNASLRDLVPPE
jgi:hypothetical protein